MVFQNQFFAGSLHFSLTGVSVLDSLSSDALPVKDNDNVVPVVSSVPYCSRTPSFILSINDLPLSTPIYSTRLFANNSLLFRVRKMPDNYRIFQEDLEALQ